MRHTFSMAVRFPSLGPVLLDEHLSVVNGPMNPLQIVISSRFWLSGVLGGPEILHFS